MIMLIAIILCQTNLSQEVLQLHKEIQIINLVNGLDLSQSQMLFIMEKAQEVSTIKTNSINEVNEKKENICAMLSELKKYNIADKEISPELKRKVHTAEAQLQERRYEVRRLIEQATKDVLHILNGHQLYQLEHYIPCLIPPPGESRIGQLDKTEGIINQLTRIRNLPEWLYEKKKYDIVEKTLEKIEKHTPKNTEFQREAARIKILQLFDEMRELSDADYMLQKNEYADKLKQKFSIEKTMLDVSYKVEHFLLDPLIIPIIEDKMSN